MQTNVATVSWRTDARQYKNYYVQFGCAMFRLKFFSVD